MTQPESERQLIGPQQFETGDFHFLGNVVAPVQVGYLDGLNNRYGEGSVSTGSAFSRETSSATGIPGLVGIYITERAFEAVEKQTK